MQFESGVVEAANPPAVIVDTDVVSYLFRGDTRAEQFRPHVEHESAILSFMTVAELDRWVLHRNWGSAGHQSLYEYISRFTIILVDRSVCLSWARVIDSA